MKPPAIVPIGVRLELDAPDLIALADACATALDFMPTALATCVRVLS